MRNTRTEFVKRTNEFTYLGSSRLIVFLVPLYGFLFMGRGCLQITCTKIRGLSSRLVGFVLFQLQE